MDDAQAGRIEATLTHISSTIIEVKEEQLRERDRSSEHRDRIHTRINELSESTSSGLKGLHGDHESLKSAFDAHKIHDDQRFSWIWKVIGPLALAGASAGAYGASAGAYGAL